MGSAFSTVASSLKKESSNLENLRYKIDFAYTKLEESVNNYIKTENGIKETIIIYKKSESSEQKNENSNEDNSTIETYNYTYSEDNIKVPIDTQFLDKNACLEMAERIIAEHGENGKCNGMSKKRIAKELFAHAVGYYTAETLINLGIDLDFIQGISESGEDADIGLGDGLDVHYNLIWYLFP